MERYYKSERPSADHLSYGAGTGAPTRESMQMRASIYDSLRRLGVHQSSEDWVLRALHPAALENRCGGIPDANSSYVVRPEFRRTTVVPAPNGVASWDAFIFTAPGDVNTVYIATAESAPGNFDTSVPPLGASFQVMRLQSCASSTVGSPYSGMIGYDASEASQPVWATITAPTSLPSASPIAFRHMYASITVHLVSSAVSNQGQVYAAQFPNNVVHAGTMITTPDDGVYTYPADCPETTTCPSAVFTNSPQIVTPLGVPYQAAMMQMVLPTNETDLASTAPGFYTDAARGGVYMPLKLCGPSQPFARCTPSGNAILLAQARGTNGSPSAFGAQLSAGYNCVWPRVTPFPGYVATPGTATIPSSVLPAIGAVPLFVPSVGATQIATYNSSGTSSSPLPWPFQMAAGFVNGGSTVEFPATTLAFDTGMDNISNACIIFRGLQGANGGFASSLQIKYLAGYEIIPSPTALDRVFVEAPSPYDPVAMATYYQFAILFADAYPASYNSLGDLWDKIKEAASFVWNKVLRPVSSAVLPMAAGVIADEFAPGFGPAASHAVAGLLAPPPASRTVSYDDAEAKGAIDPRTSQSYASFAQQQQLHAIGMADQRRSVAARDKRKLGWVATPLPPPPPQSVVKAARLRAKAKAVSTPR